MIKSMTGFGKGEAGHKDKRFVVEVRTVNHRYFDLSSRIPNGLKQLEDKINSYLHKYIKRGKVDFSLTYKEGGERFDTPNFNMDVIEKHYKTLYKIKTKFKLGGDIRLSDILSLPDIFAQDDAQYDIETVWPVLEKAVKKAVEECVEMRKKEGWALYQDIAKRADRVEDNVNEIADLVPALIAEYKKNMKARVQDILKDDKVKLDSSRLATEIALFARQTDISEEIARAKSHLKAIKDALLSNQEAGRRLDFLLQELQREINTMGAKASHVKAARRVVDIKSEIEKMREQVQNVE